MNRRKFRTTIAARKSRQRRTIKKLVTTIEIDPALRQRVQDHLDSLSESKSFCKFVNESITKNLDSL